MELLYYVSSYIFNLIYYYQFSVSEDISHENDNTQNNFKLSVCKNNNLHVNNNPTDSLKLVNYFEGMYTCLIKLDISFIVLSNVFNNSLLFTAEILDLFTSNSSKVNNSNATNADKNSNNLEKTAANENLQEILIINAVNTLNVQESNVETSEKNISDKSTTNGKYYLY